MENYSNNTKTFLKLLHFLRFFTFKPFKNILKNKKMHVIKVLWGITGIWLAETNRLFWPPDDSKSNRFTFETVVRTWNTTASVIWITSGPEFTDCHLISSLLYCTQRFVAPVWFNWSTGVTGCCGVTWSGCERPLQSSVTSYKWTFIDS